MTSVVEQARKRREAKERMEKEKAKKLPVFEIAEAGNIGKKIYQDISEGISGMVPVTGRIYLEVYVMLEDENFFKDDETRHSKLIIEFDLEQDKKGDNDGK